MRGQSAAWRFRAFTQKFVAVLCVPQKFLGEMTESAGGVMTIQEFFVVPKRVYPNLFHLV